MFVTDKKVLSFSRDVTQSLAPDSEYISWCQHFLLPCSKYCWSGQVSFHWKDHFLSWLRGREKLVRVQTCYLRLCQFRLQPLQFSAENFPTSQGSKAEKCEFAVGAQAPGEFLTSPTSSLTASCSEELCQKRYSWKELQEWKQKSLQTFCWTKILNYKMSCPLSQPC